jgi:hypothetical protein
MSLARRDALIIMKKTYRGSCHCGAVKFTCDTDLSKGTMRCNCSFCTKARTWLTFVPRADLTLLQGEEMLTDYRHTPPKMEAPFLHLTFCRQCGIRPFASGGSLPAFNGPFYGVNVACLDDATDEELAAAKIHYADGRHDDWDKEASYRYL